MAMRLFSRNMARIFLKALPLSLTRARRLTRAKGAGAKGVGVEWHLLNFPRMPMYSDFLSGDRPGFGQQGKGFWLSLDGSRLNASGTIAHALFGDQHEQRAEFSILNSTDVLLAPSDPKLERVFEAQRARQAFGERGGLGHHQPDEVVGE